MKSGEEFKAAVWKRKEAYERKQKKIRKQIAIITSATAACLMLCFALALAFFMQDTNGKDHFIDEIPESAMEIGDAKQTMVEKIVVQSVLSGQNNDHTFTDPHTIHQMMAYLEQMTANAVEAGGEELAGISYHTITVTELSGNIITYTLMNDQYQINNGPWMQIKNSEITSFETWMDALASH